MLSIGTVYSFQTLAPAILGQRIANAKLTAIVDYNTAIRYVNVVSQYSNIMPHLPTGTPRNICPALGSGHIRPRRRGRHRRGAVHPQPPCGRLRADRGDHPGLVPPHQEAAGAPEPDREALKSDVKSKR